ncbi:hypothetical protein C0989_000035 [Termitomyces sp. Mn162]|nr:hypothetical protein C0989_000035 [Termitomyces sp. Mn162]
MVKVSRFSLSFAALFSFILIPALAAATARSRYSEAHSLGKDYEFDPRDGWQTIKATDLSYKYPRNSTSVNKGLTEKRNAISKLGTIGDIASHVWKGMKGIGKLEKVTITCHNISLPAGTLVTISKIQAVGRKEDGLQRFVSCGTERE